jgi:hypothetical protein
MRKKARISRDQRSLFGEQFSEDRLSRRDAAIRRDDGIRRARKHAEARLKSWRLLGMVALEKYLVLRGDDKFLTEEFIEWGRKEKVPQPPDGRAWGSVISSAQKLDIIEKAGTRNAATSNLSPKVLWKKKH